MKQFIANVDEVEYAGDLHNTYSGKLYLDKKENTFHFVTTAGVMFLDRFLSYNIVEMSNTKPRDNGHAAEIVEYVCGSAKGRSKPTIRDIWMARVGLVESKQEAYHPEYKERWFRLGANIKLTDEELEKLTTGSKKRGTKMLATLLKEGRVTLEGNSYAPEGDDYEPETPEFEIDAINITVNENN